MRSNTQTVLSPDGTQLFVHRWLPDGEPTAIVLISHGMAEHGGRYARFAEALTGVGYAVYAEDHRGHGRTANRVDVGYLSDADGFDTVVGDLAAVAETALKEFPGRPVALFGHSMGSMIARHYASIRPGDLAALIVCGTGGDPGPAGHAGRLLAKAEAKLRGPKTPSPMMDKLIFKPYNRQFKPNRTSYDWLSRDDAEVDTYIADPDCGVVFSSGFFDDLLTGLMRVNSDASVQRIRKDLPILLVSGDRDPVGDNGRGVRAVGDQLERAGITDLTRILYPGARHEILNETNRDQVTGDIVAWLQQRIPT